MSIRIELYGIPRQRAGVSVVSMPSEPHTPVSLNEALAWLRKRIPALAAACITNDNQLATGYAANINGERFIARGDAVLVDGDTLLLLSADAGG